MENEEEIISARPHMARLGNSSSAGYCPTIIAESSHLLPFPISLLLPISAAELRRPEQSVRLDVSKL